MTRAWNTLRLVGLASLAIYVSQSTSLFSPHAAKAPVKLARDDNALDLPRHGPRKMPVRKPGGVVNVNGNEPCAWRAGIPYEWETVIDVQKELEGDLLDWNACTGNLQMSFAVGITYNSEEQNSVPGGLLGGPFGWFWRDESSSIIQPGTNSATLIDYDGTPFQFKKLSTSGGKTYYEDQQLMPWNLVDDESGSSSVWRLQFPDGTEREYTPQKYGIQITSFTNSQGKQLWHYEFANGLPTAQIDYENQMLMQYQYYDSSSPSAGRVQYMTPIWSKPFELFYDPVTYQDMYLIEDPVGLDCKFIYESHIVVEKQCENEITTYVFFQDGALSNITEPTDEVVSVDYNHNGDGTTTVTFGSNWADPTASLAFTKATSTVPPYVTTFTNGDGETESVERNTAAMGTPPSLPGPATKVTDFQGSRPRSTTPWRRAIPAALSPASPARTGSRRRQHPAPPAWRTALRRPPARPFQMPRRRTHSESWTRSRITRRPSAPPRSTR